MTAARAHTPLDHVLTEAQRALDTVFGNPPAARPNPAGTTPEIMPIVGSGRLERIENAGAALNIPFSEQEWLSVYTAAQGKPLP